MHFFAAGVEDIYGEESARVMGEETEAAMQNATSAFY